MAQGIHLQNPHLHTLARGKNIFNNPIGRQGNFRGMNQPFQTFFETGKSAVRHQGRNNRWNNRVDRVLRLNGFPWIGSQTLQAESYPAALRCNFHHLHFNPLSNFADLVGMGYASPGKFGNVNETFHAAQVYENPKFSYIGHLPR